MGLSVTAKSVVPNHEFTSSGANFKFDHAGFFTTKDPKLIRILEKYHNRPGFWSIVTTNTRSTDYKGTVHGRSTLIIGATKLGFSELVGKDPRQCRNEELIEFIKERSRG